MARRVLWIGLAAMLAASAARADRVVLANGEMLEGKAREWGTEVRFWDRYGEEHVFPRPDVHRVVYERPAEERVKPDLPDLTVACIERLPRDPGFHRKVAYALEGKKDLGVLVVDPAKYQLHRKAGEKATFVVHVLNAGGAAAGRFRYRVAMDGKELDAGAIGGLKPAEEALIRVPWTWQDGQHHIQVELDTEKKLTEITRLNNTFTDPTRALTFFFGVHETTYANFSKVLNVVDSFCFEDWAQYHVHMMNDLFARSKWPSTPDGIPERVRVDKIVTGPSRNSADYDKHCVRQGDPESIVEYNGIWLFGLSDPIERTQKWALSVDWGLPHELGHQLGLIDLYQLNVDPHQILVRRADGTFYTNKYFFPTPTRMMHWHGPHLFSEHSANYLTQTHGRPRGYFGDYLYDLPKHVAVRVLSASGKPVAGAKVQVYQRQMFADPRHHIHGKPIAEGTTDAAGTFVLPNRPAPKHTTLSGPGFRGYTMTDNPWGHIHVVGMNGTLLLRVAAGGREEFHFLTIHDANIARWRGCEGTWARAVKTRFPDAGAPEPPPKVHVDFHLPKERGTCGIWWERSPSKDVVRYNLYKKVGDGGDTIKPFTLVQVIEASRFPPNRRPVCEGGKLFEKFHENGLYSPDTFYAVTAVDAQGRESGLSDVIEIPRLHGARQAAVLPDGRVVFTAGRHNTLYTSPGNGGVRAFGIRAGYYSVAPWGLCADAAGNLIVTDGHANQVLVFSPKGDLVRRISKQEPRRESHSTRREHFNWPCDAAVDAQGNLYVAERDGCRVQSLDPQGKFRFVFGGKGKGKELFGRIRALSLCGDRLLVSDDGNRRVAIFRIKPDGVEYEREITEEIRWPDRALLTAKGNVYVCDVGDSTLKVYDSEGKLTRTWHDLELAFSHGRWKLEAPVGLCTSDGRTAYLVTRFPVRTLKVRLD